MGIHTAGVRGTCEWHPPPQPGWAPGGFTEDTLVAESAGCLGRARLGRWDHPGRDKEASSGLGGSNFT